MWVNCDEFKDNDVIYYLDTFTVNYRLARDCIVYLVRKVYSNRWVYRYDGEVSARESTVDKQQDGSPRVCDISCRLGVFII
jgi:hypothetical protein